ncbi:MAG: hypothetical protein Tsb009_38230 [Planctomycetaceae bacterium]
MNQPTVAIIGASQDRRKFGNISVRAHRKSGYRVFPVHPQETEIEGLAAYPSVRDLPVDHVDRVSVYLPPKIGIQLLDEIRSLNPDEFWLNPGSESRELVERAEAIGLNPILACSIVNLGVSPSEFSVEMEEGG